MGKAPPIIVAAVDELEKKGLVARRRDERDRRRSVVEMTDAGRGMLARADVIADDLIAEIFGALRAPRSAPRSTRRCAARWPSSRSLLRLRLRRSARALLLALALLEHADEQPGERDAHDDRLLDRHDAPASCSSSSAVRPQVPLLVVGGTAASGANVRPMPSRPTRASCEHVDDGPMPPRRWRLRIGDSRCHQYRKPAGANVRCSSTWTPGCCERRVVQGRDVPAPHRGDVEHDREDRVADRAGGALEALERGASPGAAGPSSGRGCRGSARRRAAAGAGPCASTKSCSASASIGEISAAATARIPPRNTSSRQRRRASAPCSRRDPAPAHDDRRS